jgi:hypothetical protein
MTYLCHLQHKIYVTGLITVLPELVITKTRRYLICRKENNTSILLCARLFKSCVFFVGILKMFKITYFLIDLSCVEVRECLLLFDAESFVFQFAVQKFKDQDI